MSSSETTDILSKRRNFPISTNCSYGGDCTDCANGGHCTIGGYCTVSGHYTYDGDCTAGGNGSDCADFLWL